MNYSEKTVKRVVVIAIVTALLSFLFGYWIGIQDCL